MGHADRLHWLLLECAAILFTGAMIWFGTGLSPIWPLTWFAPLFVLVLAPRISWIATAAVAVCGWSLGSLNTWHYYNDVLRIPVGVIAGMIAAVSIVFAVCALIYRKLMQKGLYWSAVFAFAASWVSFEYITSLVSPHGTAGNISYSQSEFLSFVQMASVTGIWGMSFIMMLFSAAVATSLNIRAEAPKKALSIVGNVSKAIAMILLLGVIRSGQPPEIERSVKIGLVSSDKKVSADADAVQFHSFAEHASALAASGAKIIVFPETIGSSENARSEQEIDAVFQPIAEKYGATIIVGLDHLLSDSKLRYNEARIYSSEKPVSSFQKHHLLPPFESKFQAGERLALIAQRVGVVGVAICKDMDFMDLARKYARAGTGLMAVPAWDFVVDRIAHGRMAVMRGVENGFSVARTARQGMLTLSDNKGRIIAEASSDSSSFVTLFADLPVGEGKTIFARFGDWFAWLALAILAFSSVKLLLAKNAA